MNAQPKFQTLTKVFGIISMVLSVLLLIGRFIPIILYLAWACALLPWIFGIVALVFGIIDCVKAKVKGGMVLGIVALCVELLCGILYVVITFGIAIIAGIITAVVSYS